MNKITLGLLALTLPLTAHSNAGRALFVDGVVKVKRGAETQVVERGFALEAGDVIQTSSNARAHLRMTDRTLISLRPETEFGVEEYIYRPRSGGDAGSGKSSKGVFRLLRGAMRAITGAIAADNRHNFTVQTRIAAIGVRGTTFDVACVNICNDGVVFGVSDGSISATTQAGSLVLETNEYGFAAAPNRPPTRLVSSPRELRDDLTPRKDEDEDDDEIKSEDDGSSAQNDDDLAQTEKERPHRPQDGRDDASIEPTEKPLQGARQSIAYSAGPMGNAGEGAALSVRSTASSFQYNANGELTAFDGQLPESDTGPLQAARFSLSAPSNSNGTTTVPVDSSPASNVESGMDPETGIMWGRWSGGDAYARRNNGSVEVLDLSAASLHYIYGEVQDNQPQMPSTGIREFDLVGNTDPTDERGNRGFLGSATLVADFTNQTVDSTLALVIDDQNWAASGSGDLGSAVSNNTPANLFAGDYSSVLVNGSPTTGGSGAFAGFFSENAGGAGLSYVLRGDNAGSPTVISGAAAFAAD